MVKSDATFASNVCCSKLTPNGQVYVQVPAGEPCPATYNTKITPANKAIFQGITLCKVCSSSNSLSFFGEASGGIIEIIVDNESISYTTSNGEGASTVASQISNLINSNGNLSAMGISSSASGGEVIISNATDIYVSIEDTTLNSVFPIPTLSQWGLIILSLLVLIIGVVSIRQILQMAEDKMEIKQLGN